MNGKRIITVYLSVISACVIACGCITTDHEPLLLRRYQQQMLRAVGDAPVSGRIISSPSALRSAKIDGSFRPVDVEIDPETDRKRVELTLREAIHRAIANSTAIMVTAFDPAMSREELAAAEAEFDAIFRASVSFQKLDAQSNYPSVIGRSKETALNFSLSQRYASGAQAGITYSLTRTRTYNSSYYNDPNFASKTAIELTQPLLRDFGSDVNLAKIRVGRMNYDISMQAFRSQMLATIEEVQSLYWRLVQARQDVAIQQRQLERSLKTLEHVEGRSRLDATKVQITNAQSVVATSRLTLVQAQRIVGDVQGRLIKAIGDPSLQLLDDFDLMPVSNMSTEPVQFDVAGQLAIALRYNPDLEQVRKSLEIQDISVRVAKNQALPRLDLKLGMAYNGAVASGAEGSWHQMSGGDYIDYNLSVAYEWPIGNRSQLASLRRAKYAREKTLANMQDTSDQLAVAISEAVRLIDFSYREILVSQSSLKAHMDNLDALEARRETVEALTPDFLNRLLQAQENVAAAERSVIEAMVKYNTAQASLMKLNGTALGEAGIIVEDNDNDVLDLLNSYIQLSGQKDPIQSAMPAKPSTPMDTASADTPNSADNSVMQETFEPEPAAEDAGKDSKQEEKSDSSASELY